MKGFSEIYPDEYKELRDDEERLGFTLDNKKNLDDFICGAKSCLCLDDKQAVHSIKTGEFTLHQVGSDVRVLTDINSLVTTTANKGDVFKDNQTIRVCDQIATDIANLFVTKYLGVVPNDASGRTSLWADIVKHHENMQSIRAIEKFTDEDVTVDQGETKKSVVVTDNITVVNTMEKLYMTVYVA